MTVEQLLPQYEAYLRRQSFSPRSIRCYRRTILAVDRELPCGWIATGQELETWLWSGDLMPNTRVTYHKAFVSFYGWAKEAGVLDFNPAATVTRPKVPRGVPRAADNEIARRVLTEAIEPYRLWAILAAYNSLRRIEIFRLHREHITETSLTVVRGKGGHSRILHTHPAVWAAVKELPPGPVADQHCEECLGQSFARYCRTKLEVKVTLHPLRGWHATTSFRHTKDIRAVQHNMGHASIETTAGYIALGDDQLRDAVLALPTFGAAVASPAADQPDHPQ